jgi:hypothetical protein
MNNVKKTFPSKLTDAVSDGSKLTHLDKFLGKIPPSPPISSKFDDVLNDDYDEDSQYGNSIIDKGSLAESWSHISSASRSMLSRSGPSIKTVSGSQFKANLKVPIRCVNCSEFKYTVNKLKDTVRKLKLQVMHLEEDLKSKENGRKLEDVLFASTENIHGAVSAPCLSISTILCK